MFVYRYNIEIAKLNKIMGSKINPSQLLEFSPIDYQQHGHQNTHLFTHLNNISWAC
jgi:hypothetical protein